MKTHTVFHYIGCWLLCVSLAVFLTAIVVGVAVFDSVPYTNYIDEESFAETILPLSEQAVEAECLFYGIPSHLFEGEPFDADLYRFAQQQLTETQAIVHNRLTLSAKPDASRYCQTLDNFFDTLPTAEHPSADIVQTIGTSIAGAAYGTVQLSLPSSIAAIVCDTMEDPLLNSLTASWPWWIVLVAAALWIGAVYGPPSPIRKWYHLSLAASVGSTAVFVPLLLLQWYDIPSRLSIGESMLTWSFSAVYTAKMQQLLFMTGIVTAVAAGSLIASVVFVTKSSQSKD